MAVPLRRCGLRSFTRHRVRAGWYVHGRLGMPCRDLGVDVVLVISAIAGEGRHRPLDLIEQGTDLRAVVSVLVGQHRRDDPTRVGVGGKVQLAPATTPLAAMLLNQPLAGTTKLQPRA